MSSQSRLSAWKKLLLSKKDLDSSNMHFDKIKKASAHSISFAKAFEEISKNEGISFLFLDPSETHLQVLHHGHVLGGNWSSPTKKLVAILGTDSDAKPVQIITKSVKKTSRRSLIPFKTSWKISSLRMLFTICLTLTRILFSKI
jgi:hypothetical protein